MTYRELCARHTRAGLTAEINGMLELAAFHYEQAEFWLALS